MSDIDLTSKREVSRLWRLGAFGNKLRTWANPLDIEPSLRESNRFSLRSLVASGKFQPNLTFKECFERWTPEFYVCEPAPDEDRIIQGEICRSTNGLMFTCSTEPLTLREALNRQDGTVMHIDHFGVTYGLQYCMSPLSWIELTDCLDLHPDAIVEFTVFNRDVGDRPGRNTIIWEVRRY